MVQPADARDQYVRPALEQLGLYSLDAEKLLMGTAAIESNFVNFVQFGGGPARGMFQMEEITFDDMVDRVLGNPNHAALKTAVFAMAAHDPPHFDELAANHLLAAALARVKYFSVPPAIPSGLADQANYWRKWYNGESPHGLQAADYIARWNQYCAPVYAGA